MKNVMLRLCAVAMGAVFTVPASADEINDVFYNDMVPTDSASHRFVRQRIASGSANSSRQRIASLCASHDVFPPWSTG